MEGESRSTCPRKVPQTSVDRGMGRDWTTVGPSNMTKQKAAERPVIQKNAICRRIGMGTISMTLYPASVVKRETERLLKRARR